MRTPTCPVRRAKIIVSNSIFAVLGTVLAVGIFGASAALAAPTTLSPEKRAAREADRQRSAASGHRSKSVVVDGTPRKIGRASAEQRQPAGERPTRLDALRSPRIAIPPMPRALLTPQTSQLLMPQPRRGAHNDINLVPGDRDAGPLRSMSTYIGEAGMEPDIGGDDIVIASDADYETHAQFAITSSGEYFVAVGALTHVDVFKSTNSGETWTLWSTFTDLPGNFMWINAMTIAEGTSNRILIAYRSADDLKVAWADITLPVPTWTLVTALSFGAVTHGAGLEYDIDTDAAVWDPYYVYVVGRGRDGDGDDIWFTRSTSMGDSYDPEYKIADTAPSTYEFFRTPSVSYGHNDIIHVCWEAIDSTGTIVKDAVYRRAHSWANDGFGAWGPSIVVKAGTASERLSPQSIAASTTDGTVLISGLFWGFPYGPRMYFSSDHGLTWPAPNEAMTGLGNGFARPLILPTGEVVMGAATGRLAPNSVVEIARSSTADLTTWSAPQNFTINLWDTALLAALQGLQADPSRGNQIACVWIQSVNPDRRLRFDAEWRRDPGYGNTEVGFPFALPGGGQTPPAIAEIDGDPYSEIVFATTLGDVYVLNHDGTLVSGWPVSVGNAVPLDAPVAVGDLNGDGVNTIVMGNSFGEVFALDPGGNILPGWPVQMDSVKAVYVNIGVLGPPTGRYVIAQCGREVRVLRHDAYDMALLGGGWGDFTSEGSRPGAVGDVDNDGISEFVSVHPEYVHVSRLGMGSPAYGRFFGGESFSDAPTLADIDNDGDLEIAVPTTSGKMYLLSHDLTDYSINWPKTMPSGQPLTSACFANIIGNSEIEIVFSERNGSGLTHLFLLNGTEQAAYPKSFGDWTYMPPIVETASVYPTNIIMATINTNTGYSWANLGDDAPGWPRNMPGSVEETPASGDIDLDGRIEIVFVGFDFVTVFDVGVAPDPTEHTRWPMYGYDAERSGCLDCTDLITGVGDVPSLTKAGILQLEAFPNPFNPATTVSYEVTTSGPVSLVLYDITGRLVDVLLDGEFREAQTHSLSYESRAASGIYFLWMESGGKVITRKISLLK